MRADLCVDEFALLGEVVLVLGDCARVELDGSVVARNLHDTRTMVHERCTPRVAGAGDTRGSASKENYAQAERETQPVRKVKR